MILNRENMRNKKVILILCLLVLVSGSVQAQRLKAVQNEKGRYGFMTEAVPYFVYYKKGRNKKEKDETVLELVKKLLNDIKSLLEEKKDVIMK